jgi:hypothetical protein
MEFLGTQICSWQEILELHKELGLGFCYLKVFSFPEYNERQMDEHGL